MRVERRESRPDGNGAALTKSSGGDTHSLANTTDSVPLATRARRRDHGIRVVFERTDGVVCSQVFATIESAEKKVGKVRERGLQAQMQLVRLVPVGIELDTTTVPTSVTEIFENNEISMPTEVV